MAEKPFEREVLDRLIAMEVKIDAMGTQCTTCAKILVINKTLGFQWFSIGVLGLCLATLAKLWYDAQGRIMEYISGVVK